MMFASKTPRDLNHDPIPMIYPFSGQRASYADESLGWVLSPRPEFDHVQHNEPNAILIDIRAQWRHGMSWAKFLATFDYVRFAAGHYVTKDWVRVTDDHRLDHARLVIARLATIEERGGYS